MGLQHGGAPAARQGQEPTLQGGPYILYIIINHYIFIILLLQGGRLQEDGEEGQEEGQIGTHGGGSAAVDSANTKVSTANSTQ